MFYSEEEIIGILNELKLSNKKYFIWMLPNFIWSNTSRTVVDYSSTPDNTNALIIIETEPHKVKKDLKAFFEHLEIEKNDVLIFCVNEEFIPKAKGNWIRMKILRNII